MNGDDIFISKIKKLDPEAGDILLFNVNRKNRYSANDLEMLKNLKSQLSEMYPDITFVWVPFSSSDFEMSHIGDEALDELITRMQDVQKRRAIMNKGMKPDNGEQ